MAAAKKTYTKTVVGAGSAAFVHLAEPDTEGEYADNKYKITLLIDKDSPEAERFEKLCKKAGADEFPKAKSVKLPLRDGDEKEQEHFHGKYMLTAKTKKQPTTVDGKKQKVPADLIKPGDIVKVSVTLNPCKVSGKPTVALWLNGVQLIEKVNNGFDAADDFDEEEGFEYEGDSSSSGSSDDQSDDSGDDAGDDDADF